MVASLAVAGCAHKPAIVEVKAPAGKVDTRQPAIDAIVETEMAKRDIIGASLAIVRNGDVTYTRGYGLADVDANKRATAETRFVMASMTKMFTATATMLLVKDGRLQLHQKIGDTLSGLPQDWKAVTVRQLLTHTSGLEGFADFEDTFPCPTRKSVPNYEMGDVLDEVSCLPLAFKPGSGMLYSETNYHLLAMIVRDVSGMSYENFVRQRILQPLQMTRTDFLRRPDERDDRATGYLRQSDGSLHSEKLYPTVELSLVSTVGDVARFDRAISRDVLVSKAMREQMWTPAGIGGALYGFGFSSRPIDGRRQVGHTGGGPAASTAMAHYLDDDLTIVLLTNTAQPPGTILSLVDAIADEVIADSRD